MANSTKEIFRINLKYFRNKRGFTQEKLSELCGISSDYLSEIERGRKTPSFTRMDLICDALGIEAYKLFKPMK